MSDITAPSAVATASPAFSRVERPEPAGPLAASLAFSWRALLKIKHVPEQLFDVTVFPVMFTLLFTYLFGGALAGSTREYLQFLLPGILVQTVVLITLYTGTNLNTDIKSGVFDRFRSMPVWQPSSLVGMLVADAVRYTTASAVIVILGLVLGFRPGGGAAGVILAVALVVLFCFGLSWCWTLLGLKARSAMAVQGWSMMIMFPLTFASNIFVSPETMPGWLEAFVKVNPVTLLTTASRGLMSGHPDGGATLWVLAITAAFTAVFGPLTMWAYRNQA